MILKKYNCYEKYCNLASTTLFSLHPTILKVKTHMQFCWLPLLFLQHLHSGLNANILLLFYSKIFLFLNSKALPHRFHSWIILIRSFKICYLFKYKYVFFLLYMLTFQNISLFIYTISLKYQFFNCLSFCTHNNHHSLFSFILNICKKE